MENDCLFCKIVAGEISAHKIYEDENFLSFLDIYPTNPGHALIIPKEHHRNIFDLPANILEKAGPVAQKIAAAVRKAATADGLNIIMNNEPAAGQIIFHAHIHLVPRFENDGFKHWKGKNTPTEEELHDLMEKIKKNLS